MGLSPAPNRPVLEEVPVRREADVAVARRVTDEMAARLGFPERRRAEAVLVASELATNLVVHHAEDGLVRVFGLGGPGPPLITVAALDRGPGIPDLAAVLRDGTSSDQGLGAGLGTVFRLADRAALCSGSTGPAPCPCPGGRPFSGTLVAAELSAAPARPRDAASGAGIETAVLLRPGPARGGALFYAEEVRPGSVTVQVGLRPERASTAPPPGWILELGGVAFRLRMPPEGRLFVVDGAGCRRVPPGRGPVAPAPGAGTALAVTGLPLEPSDIVPAARAAPPLIVAQAFFPRAEAPPLHPSGLLVVRWET
nr:ATP-binding protein [Dissulfurirhabdus thermomarina]